MASPIPDAEDALAPLAPERPLRRVIDPATFLGLAGGGGLFFLARFPAGPRQGLLPPQPPPNTLIPELFLKQALPMGAGGSTADRIERVLKTEIAATSARHA